ncbi:hypothetical protein L9F63_000297 [Diploptera punctata]|uniref:Phosphatidylinositol-glycan biosynthesis class X protein n=1 Tax=Diploptera punctata TaxID=6984 RepID=A0AAD8ALX3_DIPPU|nr:hypothetical protein L9F63_000297 [Diploptera punctata]
MQRELIVKWLLLTFTTCAVNCNKVCDIHATIIRRIENEGFHRDVNSLVEIVTGHSTLWGECMLILEEHMPSGLYVNPDQLADLRRVNQLQGCPIGKVDIEAPQKDSTPHSVQVYSHLNRTENLLSAHLSLPFHVRYHSPIAHGGYSIVKLGAPSLLLRCQNDVQCVQGRRVQAPCRPCKTEMCQWVNLTYKTNSPRINMYVPVGNSSHQGLVTLVTLLVTCGGCVYILSAIADSYSNARSRRVRHSRQSPCPSECNPTHK